ncbi:MAG: class I SAM-dependent methyltransferase [Planctomycetes bacterium]|nr:class I SAM-dependent methyltransferase [Planctomycetota bacterium]
MKVDQTFARQAYSHPGAVRGYSRAVSRVGLWKCEKAFFARHLPTEGRILDLGCGAGRTTFGLWKEGYRDLLGADLSPVMIREARKHAASRRLKIRFRVADACRLSFPAGSFEGCVFSFNGLMTIPKRAQRLAALRGIRRVLAPGGRFVFTTHQRLGRARERSLWRKERALWKAGRQDPRLHDFGDQLIEELGRPTFVHVPDRREILDCLERAGLEWLEDEYPDLGRESKAVRNFVSHGCRFWAARRPDAGSRPGHPR